MAFPTNPIIEIQRTKVAKLLAERAEDKLKMRYDDGPLHHTIIDELRKAGYTISIGPGGHWIGSISRGNISFEIITLMLLTDACCGV